MFEKFVPAPPIAEQFPLREFIRERPAGDSRFLPGRLRPAVSVLSCPACEEEQIVPEHGTHTGCCQCDLKWVVFGATISIWRESTPQLKLVK
jgi:hypothetical protein